MNVRATLFAPLGLLLTSFAAYAGEATVVLDVHHAYCPLCPSIVKNTLEHVKGVTNVVVGRADGNGDMSATITYDDSQGSPAAMIKAATDHGYPAEVSDHTNG
jgi:mercuric ion binding protein